MLRLNIPFSEKDRVKELARAKGSPIRWESDQKFWYFPGEKLPKFLEEFSIETPEKPKGAKRSPEKTSSPITKVLAIDYTYFPFARAAGARWDPEHKVCTFKGNTLPLELTGFEPQPYSWEEYVQNILNDSLPPKRNPIGKLKPRIHQKEAIAEILKAYDNKYPGFLLADEVGLGKSITAWSSILNIEPRRSKRILIVCPLAVIPVWRETISDQGDGGNEIIILNYDRLKKIYEMDEGKKAKTLKGIARKGHAMEFDIIIFDECHKIKNPTSSRSKLATGLYKAEPFVLWLSATAGQNVLELAYLAPLLAHLTGDKVLSISKDFENWCKSRGLGLTRGKFGKWELDESEADNNRIHELIFKQKKGILGGIRRRPQDIAGWPEIQRIPYPVELDHDGQALYSLAWKEFLSVIKNESFKTPKEKALSSAKGLGELIRLRQKASMLKTEFSVNLALELIDNGRQVAISTQFLDPAKKIQELLEKEKIPCGILSGEQNPKEKENVRISYQTGALKVIIFTVEEGISLHAGQFNNVPRAQINHDPRWSAISAHQIDGRSHRNGTFAPVYWMFLKETIEERVITRLMEKMQSMREIHGDEKESLQAIQNFILDQIK